MIGIAQKLHENALKETQKSLDNANKEIERLKAQIAIIGRTPTTL